MTDTNIKHVMKRLSANDLGLTGAHQAGLCVPKKQRFLDFFPPLDSQVKNPSLILVLTDSESAVWHFRYIHYNNRSFGGTRNEYRLTRMTGFFRKSKATLGDWVRFSINEEGQYLIDLLPSHQDLVSDVSSSGVTDDFRLVFDGDWQLLSN